MKFNKKNINVIYSWANKKSVSDTQWLFFLLKQKLYFFVNYLLPLNKTFILNG